MHDNYKLYLNGKAITSRVDIERELRNIIKSRIDPLVKSAAAHIPNKIKGVTKLNPNDIDYDDPPQENSDDSSYMISQKIAEMRKSATVRYNTYFIKRDQTDAFIRQGEILKDLEDDFEHKCYCAVEVPTYNILSNDQIRTYITWRTDARRGIYNKTAGAYVMLYCYELLNKIGTLSSTDAYNRLAELWVRCRSFYPKLDAQMPRLLKDFYAYNDIEAEPPENNFPIKKEDDGIGDILEGNYSQKLDYLLKFSNYNIKESIFFSENDTGKMIEGSLEETLNALDKYFSGYGLKLSALIAGKFGRELWTPFSGCPVDFERMDGFHPYYTGKTERYSLKSGKPCLENIQPAFYVGFSGYILKSIESELRTRTGFRYKLKPNISAVLKEFNNRPKVLKAVGDSKFSETIRAAVNLWCDKNGVFSETEKNGAQKPVNVEIDISKLEKIRRESDEIAEKLNAAEEAASTADFTKTENNPPSKEKKKSETTVPEKPLKAYDFSGLPSPWNSFAAALSSDNLELLEAVNNGGGEDWCRKKGKMLNAETDSLNSSALETIGDIIIENGSVIEDYKSAISDVLTIFSNS